MPADLASRAAMSARGRADPVRLSQCKVAAAEMSSTPEMPAAATAREREGRNEHGTGKRRRDGGEPNVAGHGPGLPAPPFVVLSGNRVQANAVSTITTWCSAQ
jgi:hypothetical protein